MNLVSGISFEMKRENGSALNVAKLFVPISQLVCLVGTSGFGKNANNSMNSDRVRLSRLAIQLSKADYADCPWTQQ